MNDQPMVDGLVRVPEAARYLGLSRSKVYAMMECGELPFVKFGKSRRITRAELMRLVERHLVRPPSGRPAAHQSSAEGMEE